MANLPAVGQQEQFLFAEIGMELTLCKGDGSEESWSYPLNAAEQEVLMRKMEEFCQQQTGMSLRVYAQQFREEQMQAPEMQM